ncbi:MAG: hypothetical protein WCR66_13485 [Bacteroidota bacterium]
MKLLLDIQDNKAEFVIEMLKNFKFIKAERITPEKAQLIKEIKESVEYINLVKKGKAKARPVQDLLNEL